MEKNKTTEGDRGKNLRHLKDQRHKRGMEIQQAKYTGELKGRMRQGKTKHDTRQKSWKSNAGEYQTQNQNLNITKGHESTVITSFFSFYLV